MGNGISSNFILARRIYPGSFDRKKQDSGCAMMCVGAKISAVVSGGNKCCSLVLAKANWHRLIE